MNPIKQAFENRDFKSEEEVFAFCDGYVAGASSLYKAFKSAMEQAGEIPIKMDLETLASNCREEAIAAAMRVDGCGDANEEA
jgi:hypothetical protein